MPVRLLLWIPDIHILTYTAQLYMYKQNKPPIVTAHRDADAHTRTTQIRILDNTSCAVKYLCNKFPFIVFPLLANSELPGD